MDRVFTDAQVRVMLRALETCKGVFLSAPSLRPESKMNLTAMIDEALAVLDVCEEGQVGPPTA